MPRSKISKITVTHVWDDDSETEYTIGTHVSEESGGYVYVDSSSERICFHPESWDDIRDQIDEMMYNVNGEV